MAEMMAQGVAQRSAARNDRELLWTSDDQRQRDSLLDKYRREAERCRRKFGDSNFTITALSTQPSRQLQNGHRNDDLPALIPIFARRLRAGGQHSVRILQGTVVFPPVVVKAVQFFLQDERGSVVYVCVYGAPRCGLEAGARAFGAADELFKEGTVLAVREPFFKVMGDGCVATFL